MRKQACASANIMRNPFCASHLDKNALGTQGSLLADVGISVLQVGVDLVWSMYRCQQKQASATPHGVACSLADMRVGACSGGGHT